VLEVGLVVAGVLDVAPADPVLLLDVEELEPQPARAKTRAHTVAVSVMRTRAGISREVSWPSLCRR
jgi:hypothetical protein